MEAGASIENVYYSALFLLLFFCYVGVRWCVLSKRKLKLKNRDLVDCNQDRMWLLTEESMDFDSDVNIITINSTVAYFSKLDHNKNHNPRDVTTLSAPVYTVAVISPSTRPIGFESLNPSSLNAPSPNGVDYKIDINDGLPSYQEAIHFSTPSNKSTNVSTDVHEQAPAPSHPFR